MNFIEHSNTVRQSRYSTHRFDRSWTLVYTAVGRPNNKKTTDACAPLQSNAGMPDVVVGAHCVRQGLLRAIGSSRECDSLDPLLRSLGLFVSFDLTIDHAREAVRPV